MKLLKRKVKSSPRLSYEQALGQPPPFSLEALLPGEQPLLDLAMSFATEELARFTTAGRVSTATTQSYLQADVATTNQQPPSLSQRVNQPAH